MYNIDTFIEDIEVYHMEVTFDYEDQHYFISDNVDAGPNGEPIMICGPETIDYVNTADEALDKLIVDGKPMRDRMDEIIPN